MTQSIKVGEQATIQLTLADYRADQSINVADLAVRVQHSTALFDIIVTVENHSNLAKVLLLVNDAELVDQTRYVVLEVFNQETDLVVHMIALEILITPEEFTPYFVSELEPQIIQEGDDTQTFVFI